jgi:UDP-2-acetamido-2-deoxy-ribo-hexuluronate aminotransferase
MNPKDTVQFIDLASQRKLIAESVQKRINKVLDHQQFILGPEITEVEQKLAQFVGVEHCVTVSNGTDALMIALMALGVKAGDEVITSPFSFFATPESIALIGAIPVFVDIDPKTYNLDSRLLEKAITAKTKAIMPVSLYGQCADIDAINTVAAKHKIPVIEDGAQSFGALYKGRRSCSMTEIATTSFFPSKPLGCYGEGGACFTNSKALAEVMKEIRVHGQSKRYYHPRLGINGRFETIQAAVILSKLEIFEREIELRQEFAHKYDAYLKNAVETPYIAPENLSVYALYTIRVKNRDSLQQALQEKGIPTAVHYPTPLYRQPALAMCDIKAESFPHVEKASNEVLSLPFHPYLTDSQIKRVADELLACL